MCNHKWEEQTSLEDVRKNQVRYVCKICKSVRIDRYGSDGEEDAK